MPEDEVFAADLRLLAGGQRLAPTLHRGAALFRLLLPAADLRLVSRVTRP